MSLPPPGYPSWQDAQGPPYGTGYTGYYGQPGYAPAPSPGYTGYSPTPYLLPAYPPGQQGYAGLGSLGYVGAQPGLLGTAVAALGGAAIGALAEHEHDKHHHEG